MLRMVHHVLGIWLGMMGVDFEAFLNLAAWTGRCAERPAMAKLGGG